MNTNTRHIARLTNRLLTETAADVAAATGLPLADCQRMRREDATRLRAMIGGPAFTAALARSPMAI